jgi:threonine/homoserine/homoserine lactone efflux protein
MDFVFIAIGILIGFVISLPSGPVGFLCVHRTIARGMKFGLLSALGSVLADMVYASIVIFSITSLKSFFLGNHGILEYIGGIILIIVGYVTYNDLKLKKMYQNFINENKLIVTDAFSTFAMTITNPLPIITFSFIFSAIGAVPDNFIQGIFFILGIGLGASLWWLLFTFAVDKVRSHITEKTILLINKISGACILTIGVIALLRAII